MFLDVFIFYVERVTSGNPRASIYIINFLWFTHKYDAGSEFRSIQQLPVLEALHCLSTWKKPFLEKMEVQVTNNSSVEGSSNSIGNSVTWRAVQLVTNFYFSFDRLLEFNPLFVHIYPHTSMVEICWWQRMQRMALVYTSPWHLLEHKCQK